MLVLAQSSRGGRRNNPAVNMRPTHEAAPLEDQGGVYMQQQKVNREKQRSTKLKLLEKTRKQPKNCGW